MAQELPKGAIDLDDIEVVLNARPAVASTAEQKAERVSMVNGGEADYHQIECPKCNGRGFKVYGYVNIKSYPCFMCKETGKVTAKRIARVEAAKKGRETAETNARVAYAEWCKTPVGAYCLKTQDWNTFAASMIEAAQKYGKLTDGQTAAVERMIAKAAVRAAEKAAAQATGPKVEISAIQAMFDAARPNYKKQLILRAHNIEISEAKASGKNPGALYVKRNGEYQGKIVGGNWVANRDVNPETTSRLMAVAVDPVGELTVFGKDTGICGICGAVLENELSKELGIGPICRKKWKL